MSDVSTTPSERKTLRPMRGRLVIAAITALVVCSAIVLSERRAVDIQAVSPTFQDIESTVSATGTVSPAVDFPARATFAGIVDRIYVHLGEKVRPGQMLAEMRDQYAQSRVDNARAALETAEINDENLRMNGTKDEHITQASDLQKAIGEQAAAAKALSTMQQLHKIGSASDAEVSSAAQRLQTANAAVEAASERARSRFRPADLQSARAKIAADKATLAAERVSYANAHIPSPIAGTVYLIPVKRYDFVQMGADLLHVANLKRLVVRAHFFEPDIKQLHTGGPVRIAWTGAPGSIWLGQIQSKPMAVTGEGVLRTGECTIAITSDTSGLPVNTSVTVTATTEKHSHVMTLPREAVHEDGAVHYVYRIENSVLKKTPIEVGIVNAANIEITKGLARSDQVALRALKDGKLKNNQRIRIQGQG